MKNVKIHIFIYHPPPAKKNHHKLTHFLCDFADAVSHHSLTLFKILISVGTWG